MRELRNSIDLVYRPVRNDLYEKIKNPTPSTSLGAGSVAQNATRVGHPRFQNRTYRARARTSVTSSGCSLSPIQSSTAMVTIWLI